MRTGPVGSADGECPTICYSTVQPIFSTTASLVIEPPIEKPCVVVLAGISAFRGGQAGSAIAESVCRSLGADHRQGRGLATHRSSLKSQSLAGGDIRKASDMEC